MFNSNLSPSFLILMIACLLHALVEASPIKTHLGKAVHHENISSTVPLYYGENPSPVYFTVTKQKSEEIRDASPEALKVILQDLTTSVDCASNFFKQNRPSDAIHILATSHIMDVNGAFADAGKKILAQNATLKKSADDMFSKLNITFPDENTKHQMFVAFSVGGVKAGGVTIKGMMTREVFEQNNALKYTFKAYDMAERYVALGKAKTIYDGISLAEYALDVITTLAVSAAEIAVILTSAVILSEVLLVSSIIRLIGATGIAVLGLFLVLLNTYIFMPGVAAGYIINNSDEELTLFDTFIKGDMYISPAKVLMKRSTMSYLNDDKELVQGDSNNVSLFIAEKNSFKALNTRGALTYLNKDGSKKFILAWSGRSMLSDNYCNVAFSGTGEDLVKNIGDLHKVSKHVAGGYASCLISSPAANFFRVKFIYSAYG